MKINIASFGGRSHLLDLARELSELGHEVRFYSFVPDKRAKHFGLHPKNNYSYFLVALPFIALMRLTKQAIWSEFLFQITFDYYTAWFSRPCDVFIGQSPMHLYSLKYLKRKYGAVTVLERGNSHVLDEVEVLSRNPRYKGKTAKPKFIISRDLRGYKTADYISIASDHVRRSFIKNGIPNQKLLINPYGVSTIDFRPTELTKENPYDILMVGQWSFRKGSDLLIKLCERTGYRLLHVGPIVDMEFPDASNMDHVDAVDQRKLIEFYKKAKIFVLPSREEGLAMVQLQAIICGLPLVCSKYTGGRDLKSFISDPKWIVEMDEYSLKSLEQNVTEALALAASQIGIRKYIDLESISEFSWNAYGKRYHENLLKL
ncbi:glycosyltransferase family 4 protein [Robiginitalea sp. SC105]|uniref:glycosyltransferase family 4 protein n=1 Tax=Robiginitalea sp. SC105 TaxID=2762332 RepID=UPI001639C986|nr:glycosyltransferase family 4 protein [Robiginitalea sp. SC105]MBC2839278.1 glycosyltransferase family 4 protein [Robiginitalea sp. SC105]